MTETVWRTEDIDPDDAAWAMSDDGRAVLEDLVDRGDEDPLVVATSLRSSGLSPSRAATAQGVAGASRRARDAGHGAHTWWTPAAAEQASAPSVVAWRARRHAGVPTVDLTAGCGGDASGLAEHASSLVAVELSPTRVPFLRANVPAAVAVVRADALRPPVDPAATWAWADPARRVEGRRLRGLGEMLPAVPALVEAGWPSLGVAVSPAMDLDDPDLPADAELEFVQVGRQLTEATLWLGASREAGPGTPASRSATLLPAGTHVRGAPTPPSGDVRELGEWLAVPEPALVRARLADVVAAELGLVRIARHRALFTTDDPPSSPWFRCERVEAVVAARPKAVRDALRGLATAPVEVVTHGLSIDVAGWLRGMGAPPRGPDGLAVHVVRLDAASRAVVTRRGGG